MYLQPLKPQITDKSLKSNNRICGLWFPFRATHKKLLWSDIPRSSPVSFWLCLSKSLQITGEKQNQLFSDLTTTVVISTHDLSGPNQASLVLDPNQTLVLTFWILHLFAFLQSLDYWRLMLHSRLWMCKILSFSQKLNLPAPQTLTDPHIKPCLVIFLDEEQSVETIICLSMSSCLYVSQLTLWWQVTGDRFTKYDFFLLLSHN